MADTPTTSDPPILLAILLAARTTGNPLLERIVRDELARSHGIRVELRRGHTSKAEDATHA